MMELCEEEDNLSADSVDEDDLMGDFNSDDEDIMAPPPQPEQKKGGFFGGILGKRAAPPTQNFRGRGSYRSRGAASRG